MGKTKAKYQWACEKNNIKASVTRHHIIFHFYRENDTLIQKTCTETTDNHVATITTGTALQCSSKIMAYCKCKMYAEINFLVMSRSSQVIGLLVGEDGSRHLFTIFWNAPGNKIERNRSLLSSPLSFLVPKRRFLEGNFDCFPQLPIASVHTVQVKTEKGVSHLSSCYILYIWGKKILLLSFYDLAKKTACKINRLR